GPGHEAVQPACAWPCGHHPEALQPFDNCSARARGDSGMGQQVNPIGLRLGINKTWDSRWLASKADFAGLLHEDVKIRNVLESNLKQAGISKIVIERPAKKARVTIHSARPGLVIGKKGADIEKLRREVSRLSKSEVHL